MNFYKKIIRNKKVRFQILNALKFIPDKPMLYLQYFIKHQRILNLKNPKRFTEKIQWYKLYYRNEQMVVCSDKYKVRDFVKERGLDYILNELYAVYKRPEDICLDALPNTFVLKANKGSGTNILCKDKNRISKEDIVKEFEEFRKQTETSAGREWGYSNIEPCIIAEKYLEDPSSEDLSLKDYKFICFNGEPKYIVCDVNRFTNHERNIYDLQWNNLHVKTDCGTHKHNIECPDNLDEMLDVARTLSEDFPFVRVDLYSIQGKIYFGEMTFYPWSGYVKFTPDSFDFELGIKFVLPEGS